MEINVDELFYLLVELFQKKQLTYWGFYQLMKANPELDDYVFSVWSDTNPSEHFYVWRLVSQLLGESYKDHDRYADSLARYEADKEAWMCNDLGEPGGHTL